jgi:hypothetical protein
MNIKEIIKDWLTAKGYDGLCNPDVPCGCLVNDLAPCGEFFRDCQPGYRVDIDEHTVCDCDGQGKKHWHICVNKPAPPPPALATQPEAVVRDEDLVNPQMAEAAMRGGGE